MPVVAQLIRDLLREVRNDRGWSRRELSWQTVRTGFDGVPESTIEALEVKAGRVPDAEIIRALAEALDLPLERFYEYPIALAREAAKQSEAEALRERARQLHGRPQGAPDTKRARRDHRDEEK